MIDRDVESYENPTGKRTERSRLGRFLDRLFEREEINGFGRVRQYLTRWILAKFKYSSYYLHRYTGSDWSTDPHDHPKDFISIGLWGGYTETHLSGYRNRESRTVNYRAPWIRGFSTSHAHYLRIEAGTTCWALVRVGPWRRDWGFHTARGWIQWRNYVDSTTPEELGSVRADPDEF